MVITPENRQSEDLQAFIIEQDEIKTPQEIERLESLPEVNTGEVVAALLLPTFALIALKAGEHWALQPDEAEIAGEAYGAVIDKYYPNAGASMGVETTALLVTAGLVLPRMMMVKKPKEKPAKLTNEKDEIENTETEAVNGGFGELDNMRKQVH